MTDSSAKVGDVLGLVLKGLDENLEGKEIGKDYSIKLSPEKGFGSRNPSMIKTIPMKLFREKNMNIIIKFFKDNIPGLLEVSIGHALISEALYLGLDNVVNMYLQKLK